MGLLKQFASQVKNHHWWSAGQPVVVAVSTGVDSMALLSLLEQLRYQMPQIIVAHVNHKLRPASDKEEQYLRTYCTEHNLKLVVATWPIEAHPLTGIEDAARQFRYQFFKRIMDQFHAQVLLTAHHQNDQVETVLMKLIRGGDLAQLTGIAQQRTFGNGTLIRPLLTVPKRHLIQYATHHHVKWFEDQTNQDDDVLRNRVRHHLLPCLQKENPRINQAVAGYADQLNQLFTANRYWVQTALTTIRTDTGYDLNRFLTYPDSVQSELIQLINPTLVPLNIKQVQMIQSVLANDEKPQREIMVNQHVQLVKTYGQFKLKNLKNVDKNIIKNKQIMVRLNHWYRINSRQLVGVFNTNSAVKKQGDQVVTLSLSRTDLPLIIRPWRYGDKLTLQSGGHQKISRILIDQKVPNADRKTAMVLVNAQKQVLSLLGYKNAFLNPDGRESQPYRLMIRTEIERRIP
ncbi:tRNA lysidine(34) synthetase TilS [Nicoliella lavandulae]|uniref:tRNA(Ile)-lysidine synthase n=1 Tax=Nicoliella lavandulae TaxID=3082954 RepID=A0ABU8SJU6_9LACO